MLEKLYAKAIAGDTQAAKTLVEQHAGKPQQALDLSNEDGTIRPKILEVHWATALRSLRKSLSVW